MDIAIQLLVIIILTGLNAFFAAAEMALVSIDRISVVQKADEGDHRAKELLTIIDEPNGFLATIQVGITLAGFLSSASAATGMSADVATFLDMINIPYSEQVAVILITMLLSYFILVFGELLPKQVALGKAEEIGYRVVKPINIISVATYPFVKLLTFSVNGLMKLFKIKTGDDSEEVSEERIRMMVSLGRQKGTIKRVEEQRINRIFELDDLKVKNVMLPMEEVFCVDLNIPKSEMLEQIIEKKHTRMPVIDKNALKPIGILLIKDFMESGSKLGFENVNFTKIMKKPFVCSGEKRVDNLFLEMQRNRKHMAMVMDDNICVGIVTIEDLIEEVFGDIKDEFDSE